MTDQDLLKRLESEFKKNKSIYAVYSGGSYRTGQKEMNGDIDLAVIIENSSPEDILSLEKGMKDVGREYNIPISTCYSDINQMKKDLETFKAHAHGKKRTSFLHDILNSERIYGRDLHEEIEGNEMRYQVFETYSNISELINTFYKFLEPTESNKKKCLNISIIAAKTALLLHGKYETKKRDIVKGFKENVDKDLGERLERIYADSKEGKPIDDQDVTFMHSFCYACQEYSRESIKGVEHEFREIKK
jgi:predicted nucleotidyltransferase